MVLEVRQPGEVQAQRRPGDGETRGQHDVGGALEHRVVGRLSVLARSSRFLVAADQEDRVIGGGGDRQRHHHVRRERGQPEDVVIPEEGDDAASQEQARHHHGHRDQHRGDGTVDEQQHDDDDGEGQPFDRLHARVADDVLIRGRRRRASHVRLHPWGRLRACDDVPNGLHRLVGDGLALVTGDVHLHVSGLAVDALGAGRGQRIAPEVLDVLDVCGVRAQFSDHLVVETSARLRQADHRPRARSSPNCWCCTPETPCRRVWSRSTRAHRWDSSIPPAACPPLRAAARWY